MTKLEYSDFYRFLVSLGVVLISLSILFPWLFLREPFDTALKTSDIIEFTPTAQILIARRQNTALWFIQNTSWISAVLAIGGFAFLIIGIIRWGKKQYLLDQREELETEKLEQEIELQRRELEPMTPVEIAEKGVKKAEEETRIDEAQKPSIGPRVQEYFRIETVLFDKLVECFGEDKVLTQQKIRQMPYDAILLFDDPQLTDVIIEIRSISTVFTSSRFNQTINQLVFQTETYTEATNRRVTTIPLFVFPEGNQDREIVERWRSMIQDQTRAHNVYIRPIFITEQRLRNLQCDDLKEEILTKASIVL
jgi:hypothetical protein